MTSDRRYYAWLDSLRGIACMIVFVAHACSFEPGFAPYVNGCGKIGVWLFIIISGLLAIDPYIGTGRSFGVKDVIPYYAKRFIRIYPMYTVILLGMRLVDILTWKQVIKHLLLMEAWHHLWFIPVIMGLYLVTPVLLLVHTVFKEKSKPWHFVLLLAACIIIVSLLWPFIKYPENSIGFWWYLPVYLMGMLTAFAIRWGEEKSMVLGDIACFIPIASIICLTPIMQEILFQREPSAWLQNKYLVIGALWSVCVIMIQVGDRVKSVLSHEKAFSFIGSVSLGFYFVHFPILYKTEGIIREFWIRLCFTFVTSVVMAVILKGEWIHRMIKKEEKNC